MQLVYVQASTHSKLTMQGLRRAEPITGQTLELGDSLSRTRVMLLASFMHDGNPQEDNARQSKTIHCYSQ